MTTTEERAKTCEERIDAELASRAADLKGIFAILNSCDAGVDPDEDAEEIAREELDNFALSIDVKHTMVVQISTGGPGDQFEIAIEKGQYGWELADNAATYRFLDWFDGATRRTDDESVMAYLENLVEIAGLSDD